MNHLGWEKIPAAQRANLSAQALADLATFPADCESLILEFWEVDASNTLRQKRVTCFGIFEASPLNSFIIY